MLKLAAATAQSSRPTPTRELSQLDVLFLSCLLFCSSDCLLCPLRPMDPVPASCSCVFGRAADGLTLAHHGDHLGQCEGWRAASSHASSSKAVVAAAGAAAAAAPAVAVAATIAAAPCGEQRRNDDQVGSKRSRDDVAPDEPTCVASGCDCCGAIEVERNLLQLRSSPYSCTEPASNTEPQAELCNHCKLRLSNPNDEHDDQTNDKVNQSQTNTSAVTESVLNIASAVVQQKKRQRKSDSASCSPAASASCSPAASASCSPAASASCSPAASASCSPAASASVGSPIDGLPTVVLSLVMSYLPTSDLLRLIQTHKAARSAAIGRLAHHGRSVKIDDKEIYPRWRHIPVAFQPFICYASTITAVYSGTQFLECAEYNGERLANLSRFRDLLPVLTDVEFRYLSHGDVDLLGLVNQSGLFTRLCRLTLSLDDTYWSAVSLIEGLTALVPRAPMLQFVKVQTAHPFRRKHLQLNNLPSAESCNEEAQLLIDLVQAFNGSCCKSLCVHSPAHLSRGMLMAASHVPAFVAAVKRTNLTLIDLSSCSIITPSTYAALQQELGRASPLHSESRSVQFSQDLIIQSDRLQRADTNTTLPVINDGD